MISPADARPLEPGDVLMLDTGAVRDGYFCDFDRNYAIGPADRRRVPRACRALRRHRSGAGGAATGHAALLICIGS